MIQQFVLNRQRISGEPPSSSSLNTPHATLESQQGGKGEWFWGVSGVFRALAAPLTGQLVPAAPELRDPHKQALGYWGALHYVLLHRMGWARPDRGLRWWYDAGKPVDDPTLSLISEVWDRDGVNAN